MIVHSEYSNVLKKIPKLFWQDYTFYIEDKEQLFIQRKNYTPKNEIQRFHNFSMSEKLFCYLKSGLEISETTYKERRDEIEKSEYRHILQTPLLQIFKQRRFIDSDKKTPELYFEIYNEIIKGRYINSITFISLLNGAVSNKNFESKIRKIMTSENLDGNDLVYIHFNLESVNLFNVITKLTYKQHPLFDRLFNSDLVSHFVDDLFELKNKQSSDFIDRIIKTRRGSGIYYIESRMFSDGQEVLAWFKKFIYSESNQSAENYANSIFTFTQQKEFKGRFLYNEIPQTESVVMFNTTQDTLNPMISTTEFDTTSEASQTLLKRKFSNPADYQQFKTSNSEDATALSVCSDSMERKKPKDQDVIQSLEGYEKTQPEYHPLNGTCVNLMNGEITEVSSPAEEKRDCPKDFFSKSEFQLSFFFNHSYAEKDLPYIKLHESGEVELLFKNS